MDIIQSTRISSTSAANSPLSSTYAVSNVANDQVGKPFISSATSETISPAGLDVEVIDDQLGELRGSLVAPPRRINLSPDAIAGRAADAEAVGGGGA